MRKKLHALLIISFLLMIHVSGVIADTPTNPATSSVYNVTLFARLDESVPAYEGMILSPTPQFSGQKISNAQTENVFTLYPILGDRLNIHGTVLFRVWLKSDSATFGKAIFALYELSVNGNLREITRTDGYVGVSSRISDFNFAIASVNATFEPSSAVQFRFTYIPVDSNAKVELLWNDVKTPTQVVVPCVNHVSADPVIVDRDGKSVSAYNANQTGGKTGVWIRLATVDPFGLYDFKSVTVSVTNSTGAAIIDNNAMFLESSGASFYSGTFVFNASFPVGSYSTILTILDQSGNAYHFSRTFSISYFYILQFQVTDGDGRPMSEANYTISSNSVIYAAGRTDSSGWATEQLPSSEVVGPYDIVVFWKTARLDVASAMNLIRPMTVHLTSSVYRVMVRCVVYGIPLSGILVYLSRDSKIVANATTGLDGLATFYQIPSGEYVVTINYMSYQHQTGILVQESYETLIALEIPYLGRIPYVAVLVAAIAALGIFVRSRRKLHSATVSILDNLVEDGLPQSATIMILGPSASGKTVLIENLLHASLSKGKPCVFIATVQFPSTIRKEMSDLGLEVGEHEKNGRLAFVDCYSAAAGKVSNEKYAVPSITDLTRLGTELSTCLESYGSGTEVFLDSLAPWVATIKPEFIVSFLHATGAKVKAEQGKFYFTVGTSIDRELLTKIDEASDGIIELKMMETEREPKRRLTIRKMRGRKHSTWWLDFSIHEGKGIVFHIPGAALRKGRRHFLNT
jgi:KaiC/GvpD/RAD55 family RecA-like ATPase